MAARVLGFALMKNIVKFAQIKQLNHALAFPKQLSTSNALLGRMLYSENHEYLDVDGNKAKVGITDHAQKELGDVVYVELPEVESQEVEAGEVACSVESVKAVAEVYYPASGKLIGVNDQLNTSPGLVNSDPYKEGWLVQIELTKPEQLDGLMDEEAYDKYLHSTD